MTVKWYHQYIGRTRPGDEIQMKILGWTLDTRTVGRDNQLILRKEVDTVAIEGVFTWKVNRVNPVSVGTHYPSKSLPSDTPLLLAIVLLI